MIAHKLGEQWIEVIDGKKHMVKAVEGVLCTGCMYSVMSLFGTDKRYNLHLCSYDGVCPVGAGDRYNLQIPDISIKDLGILNDDGLLPCPFCGEYPVVENAYEGFGYTPPDGYWRVYCSNDNHEISISSGKRRQESIDAWNRRA